jgi:hypothetical protein
MKPTVALLASLLAGPLLAGCGSSGGGWGGGGGGGGGGPISGTILGTAFTPTDAAALLSPSALCDLGAADANLTGVVIGFTSFANACGFATDTQLCGEKANALIVPVIVMRARQASSGAVTPLGPGTYTYSASPVPDGTGTLTQVEASVERTIDAMCTHHAAEPDITAGTVRLDTVSSTRIAGHADITFSDGSRFAGDFDVAVCATYQADLCGLITGACPAPACIP